MGTDIQEVYDSFKIKVPNADITDNIPLFIQYMKSAIAKCYRHVYDDLSYVYDDLLEEGHFNNNLANSSIELIALYMARDYCARKLAVLTTRKQYIGTQAFNKLPNLTDEFKVNTEYVSGFDKQIRDLLDELPDYSEER